MKGLTPEQLNEIVAFVQKHHKFGYVHQENRLNGGVGLHIKYIDTCYDTRDGVYWSITFREGRFGVRFSANHFTALNPPPKGWKYNNLYDLSMAYLKSEFVPKKEFMINEDI